MSDDVRSLRDDLSKLFDGLCFLESGYQHQRGMASDETTRLLNAIMPLVKAHVQAAAVEMRERCANVCFDRACEEKWGSDGELALQSAGDAIRDIPIPADALDAMLLRARIEELDSWAKHAAHDWYCPEKKIGKGSCWVCDRKADLERQLALTQPAPEREQK